MRRVYIKDIVDTFFIVVFKVLICISVKIRIVSPILVGLPLYLGWIFRVFLCAWPKSDCWSFSALIRSIGRFFRLLICITITMKVQGVIEWNWNAIFWPFWVVFALLLLVNLGVWLLFCGSLCSYIMGDAILQETAISFWLFYITSGACVVSSLFAYDFGQLLQGENHKQVWRIMMPVIFYLFFLLCFTKFVYSLLPIWWSSFFHHDQIEFNETLPTEAFHQISQRNQINQINEIQNLQQDHDNNQNVLSSSRSALRQAIQQIKKPPKYLIRMSSTYFGRPANLAFTRILHYNKKKVDEKIQQTEQKDIKMTDVSCEAKDEIFQSIDNISTSVNQNEKTITKKKRNISMPQNLQDISNQVKIPSLVVSPRKFRNCCICFEAIADAVIMECGHGGICYACSLEMWKSTGECHLCRDAISQVVQCDFTKPGRFVKVFSATRAIFGDQEDSSEGEIIEVAIQRANQNQINQLQNEQLNQIEEEKELPNLNGQQENEQNSCTNISVLSIENPGAEQNSLPYQNVSMKSSPTMRDGNAISFHQ